MEKVQIKISVGEEGVESVFVSKGTPVEVEVVHIDWRDPCCKKAQEYVVQLEEDPDFEAHAWKIADFEDEDEACVPDTEPNSEPVQYFELCISPDDVSSIFAFWMVIKGLREPSLEEVEAFLNRHSDLGPGDRVIEINPIEETEARENYNFSKENLWPVFGEEEFECRGERKECGGAKINTSATSSD